MKRVRLTVAYDGTAYCGFQLQPGCPTIEGALNEALSVLTGETIRVIGASRTDSGVHAEGNVAVFDTESTIPGDRFCAAVNTRLPEDIRVLASCEVPPDWHPRHVPCIKTYEYRIDCGRFADPRRRLYCMHRGGTLNEEAMRQGAAALPGEHDFTSFANPSSQILQEGGSAVRTLYEVSLRREGQELILTVRGNGFLYNMVRIIAGTLLEVGTGRFRPEQIREILEQKDRTRAGLTAPAKGLTLLSIEYSAEAPAAGSGPGDFPED